MSRTVVGIDVGGTFTDVAVLEDGKLSIHKLPSTPDDPSRGVNQGVADVGVADADFVHGTTVATNALLEGKGGRTALITTPCSTPNFSGKKRKPDDRATIPSRQLFERV